MINWYYPNTEKKTATKNFGCSGCGKEVENGKKYFRHNHGRYCLKCSPEYVSQYAKVTV